MSDSKADDYFPVNSNARQAESLPQRYKVCGVCRVAEAALPHPAFRRRLMDSGAQLLAAFGAPALQHIAAIRSGHAFTKTMDHAPLPFLRLVSAFHAIHLT